MSRTGSETGCWIRPGDLLLFDVVRKVTDGSCRAVQTKCSRKEHGCSSATSKVKPAVHLIEPSLLSGRSHGSIKVVKDNYGFIQMAERNADVYFPLFEVFPEEVQNDINGVQTSEKKGGRIHLVVGMEVAFDVSLQVPNSNAPAEQDQQWGGGRYSKRPVAQTKESLRARRIQILPKGTILQKMAVAESVKATVTKEDPKQPMCGTLALEKVLKLDMGVQLKKRHTLAAQLLEDVSAGRYAGTIGYAEDGKVEDGVVTMNEELSEQDAQTIIAIVDSQKELNLSWRHVSKDDSRLCFVKKDSKSIETDDLKQQQSITSLTNSQDGVLNEAGGNGKEKASLINAEGKEAILDIKNAGQTPAKKDKRQNYILKSIKYKNNSFRSEDIANTLPPGVGDVVTCDIYQYRRTGAFVVDNIKVLERKDRPPEDGATTPKKQKGLAGFVTEVVPSRQFGFIAHVDEDSGKRGKDVFFHLSQVAAGAAVGSGGDSANVAQDGGSSPPPSSQNKTPRRSDDVGSVVRKGDEVRFDIGKPGKNGKPTATNISVLPRGTLKMTLTNDRKADLSKLCTGYILIEPSHTSFVNTTSRMIAPQSGPPTGAGAATPAAGGRWDNIHDDAASNKNYKSGSNGKQEGVILLLSDPLGLFSPKPKVPENPKKTSGEGIDALSGGGTLENNSSNAADANIVCGTDAESNDIVKMAKANDDTDSTKITGTLLFYKSSSIAVRGFSVGPNSRRNNDGPRRGDLVTFGKPKGVKLLKDIRIEKPNAATSVKGVLTDICMESDTAIFAVFSENKTETRYNIQLTDVVSCDKALLKDKEQVDGILHEGRIFGVCRTKDIYLESSFGRGGGNGESSRPKERPKLNLTVKKELQGMGGKIMAQSQMAKGPISGTNGFTPGWTTRVSPYYVEEVEEEEKEEEKDKEGKDVTILKSKEETKKQISTSLSAVASEFVPKML